MSVTTKSKKIIETLTWFLGEPSFHPRRRGPHWPECPFCGKSNCLVVDVWAETWKCHYCQREGDTLGFAAEFWRVDRAEAARRLHTRFV
jgi:hypothetical protein